MWPIALSAAALAALCLAVWWHRHQLRREREKVRRACAGEAAQREHTLAAETQARQQALFNSMVEGVLVLARDGRVEIANRSMTRLLGLHEDIGGRTLLETLRWPALKALADRAAGGETIEDATLESPGAEPRMLRVNAAAWRDRDGSAQGTILVLHDITRIRQLESTRREFVANVSHELRTPLSLIKGFTETLLDGAKDDPATCERFLQKITTHAERLEFLIEDLLTISKLESGKAALNTHPLGLRELAQRVLDDLKARAAARQVTLRNAIGEMVEASADAARLEQVFVNLVDNAIKYGRAGGEVVIEANGPRNGMIEVCVRDDGPGIPSEARERVFERFFRADKARSREAGGTGLGLAIVKHIVQAHGGAVRVESEPGKGAAFIFTLPAPEA